MRVRNRGLRGLLILLCLGCFGFEWQGRVARLRRDLESTDPARRREVVRLLGSYSAREVGDTLLAALADRDPGVRAEAAEAAGRVRLRPAVPSLLDWLDEPNADVRATAVRALGRIGDARTVPSLVRALGDTNAEVRRAAVDALATIGTPDVIVPLLGRLEDTDVSVRVFTAEALGRIGDARAVVPLVGRARDDTPEMRGAVYRALGALKDERAVPALLQGAHDGTEEARIAAIHALGRLGSERAVDTLVGMYRSPDARMGRAVVAALSAIGGDEAIRIVIEALANTETRALARDALVARAGQVRADERESSVVPLLVEALTTKQEPTHVAAIADVLTRIAQGRRVPEAVTPLLTLVQTAPVATPEQAEALTSCMRALAATGAPPALVPLLERLRASDPNVQGAALEALEIYFERSGPDGRAADPLLAALSRVRPPLRVHVVRLLGTVRATRALPTLRPLVTHRDESLRLAAVEAIGRIGDAQGAAAILVLLEERDPRLRFEAAKALALASSEQTVRGLLSRARNEKPIDRHAVILAIGGALQRLGRASSVSPALERDERDTLSSIARGDDRELAARAIDALGRWGDPGNLPVLIALLDAGDLSRQYQAAFALGAFQERPALEALRRLARIRAEAAAALGEHGDASDMQRLLRIAQNEPWPVSAAASFSLARMARRKVFGAAATSAFCRIARSRDPHVRANVAVVLAHLDAPPCPDGPSPVTWLEERNAAAVRSASARWLFASRQAGHVSADAAQEALERCLQTDLAPEVVAACREPSLPPADQEADVYAYGPDGRELLATKWIALRFADGTVLVTHTDANGHLRLASAPRGPLVLDDPTSVALEP